MLSEFFAPSIKEVRSIFLLAMLPVSWYCCEHYYGSTSFLPWWLFVCFLTNLNHILIGERWMRAQISANFCAQNGAIFTRLIIKSLKYYLNSLFVGKTSIFLCDFWNKRKNERRLSASAKSLKIESEREREHTRALIIFDKF